jgi:hypothetical protein
MLNFVFFFVCVCVCVYIMWCVMCIFSSFSSCCSARCSGWERLAVLCYYSLTATSHWRLAAGRSDFCYTLIVPCSAKIVVVALFPFSFPYFLLILVQLVDYLADHCAAAPEATEWVKNPHDPQQDFHKTWLSEQNNTTLRVVLTHYSEQNKMKRKRKNTHYT